jgi:hypothetical protein
MDGSLGHWRLGCSVREEARVVAMVVFPSIPGGCNVEASCGVKCEHCPELHAPSFETPIGRLLSGMCFWAALHSPIFSFQSCGVGTALF